MTSPPTTASTQRKLSLVTSLGMAIAGVVLIPVAVLGIQAGIVGLAVLCGALIALLASTSIIHAMNYRSWGTADPITSLRQHEPARKGVALIGCLLAGVISGIAAYLTTQWSEHGPPQIFLVLLMALVAIFFPIFGLTQFQREVRYPELAEEQ